MKDFKRYKGIGLFNFLESINSKLYENVKDMETATVKFTQSGEKVQIAQKSRNLGHGNQVQVIYSDGSKGWEHFEDLID